MARFFIAAVVLGGLLISTLPSCQKVVQLNLNTTAPQLVIEGEVSDSAGPYTINISQSVGFYEDNVFPSVSGATIYLKDSTLGLSDTLVETTPGIYATRPGIFPQGVPGHTYSMYVVVRGNVYTAASTMPAVVNLDSVGYQTALLFGESTPRPIPYFQDPAGIQNDYQFVEYINGVRLDKIFLFSDRLSDGRYISEPLLNDTTDHLNVGDSLRLDMYCITAPVYTYLNEVSLITNANSQSTAPANPQSNITGGCLGYFSAHTLRGKVTVVQ
jgi:hypothetical protein